MRTHTLAHTHVHTRATHTTHTHILYLSLILHLISKFTWPSDTHALTHTHARTHTHANTQTHTHTHILSLILHLISSSGLPFSTFLLQELCMSDFIFHFFLCVCINRDRCCAFNREENEESKEEADGEDSEDVDIEAEDASDEEKPRSPLPSPRYAVLAVLSRVTLVWPARLTGPSKQICLSCCELRGASGVETGPFSLFFLLWVFSCRRSPRPEPGVGRKK